MLSPLHRVLPNVGQSSSAEQKLCCKEINPQVLKLGNLNATHGRSKKYWLHIVQSNNDQQYHGHWRHFWLEGKGSGVDGFFQWTGSPSSHQQQHLLLLRNFYEYWLGCFVRKWRAQSSTWAPQLSDLDTTAHHKLFSTNNSMDVMTLLRQNVTQ